MLLFGLRFNFYLRFENDLDFLAFKLGLVKGLNGFLGALSGIKVDECVSPILLNLNIAPTELFEKLSNILVSSRRWQIVYEHRCFFFNFRVAIFILDHFLVNYFFWWVFLQLHLHLFKILLDRHLFTLSSLLLILLFSPRFTTWTHHLISSQHLFHDQLHLVILHLSTFRFTWTYRHFLFILIFFYFLWFSPFRLLLTIFFYAFNFFFFFFSFTRFLSFSIFQIYSYFYMFFLG